MMTLSISPTGRLKRQDRRRDCQRPAFVEAQSLHVSFPQLQRDDAAIGLQPQAPASLRKAESSGSEPQPCLMGREECVRVQLGLREQGRPRAYWSGAQETVFSTSEDNRSRRFPNAAAMSPQTARATKAMTSSGLVMVNVR